MPVDRPHRTPGPAVGVLDTTASAMRSSFPDDPARLTRIAERLLDGPWRRPDVLERLAEVIPAHTGAADAVTGLLLAHFPRRPWGDPAGLARELAELPGLAAALRPPPSLTPPASQPTTDTEADRWRWPVAPWGTVGELAAAMDLHLEELDWFADPGGWLRRSAPGPLRHYRYRWWSTRGGGARLLEAPKPLLAERQRRVARRVLAAIPTHDAAHGFVPGRSAATFAAPHTGQAVVVRVDLEGFFTAVTAARLRGLFSLAGYPEEVAVRLAGLLSTATPADVLRGSPPPADGEQASRRHRQRLALAARHLPQGAPSSPAAANAVAHGLDRRLAALAGARGLVYTRYADDLAFSGATDTDTDTVALLRTVGRIVADEGFRVAPAKTRIRRSHQQQRLAGLVVNHHPAPPRAEYDQLRAILHNAAVTGPAAQNREQHPDFAAHLRGRIAWIAAHHRTRGRKLLELYHRIDW